MGFTLTHFFHHSEQNTISNVVEKAKRNFQGEIKGVYWHNSNKGKNDRCVIFFFTSKDEALIFGDWFKENRGFYLASWRKR